MKVKRLSIARVKDETRPGFMSVWRLHGRQIADGVVVLVHLGGLLCW